MNVKVRLFLLALAIALAAMLGAARAEAGTYRPPRRIVVMSCQAAGYPAGWGTGCTVYRPVYGTSVRYPRARAW